MTIEFKIKGVEVKGRLPAEGVKVADHFASTHAYFEKRSGNGFAKHRTETATMPKAERTILTALAQHGPCNKARLAILTCYAVNGGGFANALGALRSKSLIEPSEPIRLTNAGRAAAPDYEKLPTGHELVRWWRQNPVLGKAERLILDAVTSRLRPVTKSELAAMTGYAEAGGGFANALGRLRTLGLITGSRDIAASEHLR